MVAFGLEPLDLGTRFVALLLDCVRCVQCSLRGSQQPQVGLVRSLQEVNYGPRLVALLLQLLVVRELGEQVCMVLAGTLKHSLCAGSHDFLAWALWRLLVTVAVHHAVRVVATRAVVGPRSRAHERPARMHCSAVADGATL